MSLRFLVGGERHDANGFIIDEEGSYHMDKGVFCELGVGKKESPDSRSRDRKPNSGMKNRNPMWQQSNKTAILGMWGYRVSFFQSRPHCCGQKPRQTERMDFYPIMDAMGDAFCFRSQLWNGKGRRGTNAIFLSS